MDFEPRFNICITVSGRNGTFALPFKVITITNIMTQLLSFPEHSCLAWITDGRVSTIYM